MSGKRDSNSRPQPWQGCALPTELFPQMKCAKTSSGMSPNEISFSVSQCFAVQLSCLRLQRYTFFFIQQTFPYSFLRNNPKFLAQQGNLSQLGSLTITGQTPFLLISFLPRIRRIMRICLWRKEIKKFVAFPGLTPLQPDAYAQSCKRASLSEPPYLSGLLCRQTESHKAK